MGESEIDKIWTELKNINQNLTTIITETKINCPEQRWKIKRLETGFFILIIVFAVFGVAEAKVAWGILKQIVPLLLQLRGGSI